MQILSSTTMLCVCVYCVFCSQQFVHSKNLSVFIVDVVPPKCQGKLKFFEGVRPQAVIASRNFSKSLQWLLSLVVSKRDPLTKPVDIYTNNGFFFFPHQILLCVYQGHVMEHQVPAMIHNLNANPQVQKEDVTDGELYCWIQDFVLRGLNQFAHKTWPIDPPCPHRHSPYHLWLKDQIQLCIL